MAVMVGRLRRRGIDFIYVSLQKTRRERVRFRKSLGREGWEFVWVGDAIFFFEGNLLLIGKREGFGGGFTAKWGHYKFGGSPKRV